MPNLILKNPIKSCLLYNICDAKKNQAALRNIEAVSNVLDSIDHNKIEWLKVVNESPDEIFEL